MQIDGRARRRRLAQPGSFKIDDRHVRALKRLTDEMHARMLLHSRSGYLQKAPEENRVAVERGVDQSFELLIESHRARTSLRCATDRDTPRSSRPTERRLPGSHLPGPLPQNGLENRNRVLLDLGMDFEADFGSLSGSSPR